MGVNSLDKTAYNTVHQWVRRNFRKLGICEFCFKPITTQWSNKSGKYIRDRADWQELCPKCHHKYDKEVLKVNFSQYTPRPRQTNTSIRELKQEVARMPWIKWGTREELMGRLKTYEWFKG